MESAEGGNTQRHAIKGQDPKPIARWTPSGTWRAKTDIIGHKEIFHVAENGRGDYRLCTYMQGMPNGENEKRESPWTFAINVGSS